MKWNLGIDQEKDHIHVQDLEELEVQEEGKKGSREVFLRFKEFDNDPRIQGTAYRKGRVGKNSRHYNTVQDKSKFKKVDTVGGVAIYKGPSPKRSGSLRRKHRRRRAGFGCGGSCRTGFGKLSALHQGMSPYDTNNTKFGNLHDSLSIMSPYTPSAKFGIPLSTLDSFQSTYSATTQRTNDIAAKFGDALNTRKSLAPKFGMVNKSKTGFGCGCGGKPGFGCGKTHGFGRSGSRRASFGCGGSRRASFGGGYGKLF